MPIQIKLVTDPEELEVVYQFRYTIYVEEMSRIQFYADHKQKRILEPLDATASIFAAYYNGSIVGTLRLNYPHSAGVAGDFLSVVETGGSKIFPVNLCGFSVTTACQIYLN